MLREGRKLALRSRMRKETENVRTTRERIEWVRERERAGQIRATMTLGRWLRALSSVYITLSVQAKTAMRRKWNLQLNVCLQVNTCRQSICGHGLYFHVLICVFSSNCKNLSVEIHSTCVSHSMCVSSLLAFLKRAGASGFTEYTLRSCVYAAALHLFRSSARQRLPATSACCHAPGAAHLLVSSVFNNKLIYLNSSSPPFLRWFSAAP